jgi:hypothetical protein
MQRLLGWGGGRLYVVDHALRAVRQLVARRSPLILRGDGDLVPLAQMLHRLAFGDTVRFVVCDPRRANSPASVRMPANYRSAVEAFARAAGGSICLRRRRPPADLNELMRLLSGPESAVRLIVCMSASRGEAFMKSDAIELPPLEIRESEVPQIIDEYVAEAICSLSVPQRSFTNADRQWVIRHSAQTIPEIAKGTLRVVALNTSPTYPHAARRLGMATVSLDRWVSRRGPLPNPLASLPVRVVAAAPRLPTGPVERLTVPILGEKGTHE